MVSRFTSTAKESPIDQLFKTQTLISQTSLTQRYVMQKERTMTFASTLALSPKSTSNQFIIAANRFVHRTCPCKASVAENVLHHSEISKWWSQEIYHAVCYRFILHGCEYRLEFNCRSKGLDYFLSVTQR